MKFVNEIAIANFISKQVDDRTKHLKNLIDQLQDQLQNMSEEIISLRVKLKRL